MMSGTIPLSMTQQFNEYGEPLSGGQLYIIQVGTVSTPQNAYQDTALSILMPYPMTLDAAGRIPQFFLADGSVKIRLQDSHGVVQLASDSVLVIGPSAGGGGGSTVDPTQLITTGNMIFRYGVGAVAGYVRLNGLTIGSATSGSTERANADCQALFQHLWGVDASLAVSGGRGANAAADWTANKQIATPDFRGYNLGALDDMGNAAANRHQGWFASPTTLGSAGGIPAMQISVAQLPQHYHSGTTSTDSPDHHHSYDKAVTSGSQKPAGTGTEPLMTTQSTSTGDASARHTHTLTTDANAAFTNNGFSLISPRKLVTFYIKL